MDEANVLHGVIMANDWSERDEQNAVCVCVCVERNQ